MWILRRARWLLVLGWVGCLVCCSGATGPATPGGDDGTFPSSPPAPPVEIPAFLTFPQSVNVDVDKVQSSGTGTLAALVSVGDDLSETIEAGAKFAGIAASISNDILSHIKAIEVPVDPRVKNFHGLIEVEEDTLEVQLDFSPFDLDGDGFDEECAGCTCPIGCGLFECPREALLSDLQPVCYRVWFREWESGKVTGPYQRFLAGIIDRLPIRDNPATEPSEENAGNGRFRFQISLPSPLLSPVPGRFSVTTNEVAYAHTDPGDPFHQATEFSQFQEILQSETPIAASQRNQHIKVEAEGLEGATADDQVRKTIRSTFLKDGEGGGTVETRYLARYRDDAENWSGSVSSTDPNFDFNFDAACASILTGFVIDPSDCRTDGIDVGEAGLEFLGFVEREDVSFPDESEFQSTPPL